LEPRQNRAKLVAPSEPRPNGDKENQGGWNTGLRTMSFSRTQDPCDGEGESLGGGPNDASKMGQKAGENPLSLVLPLLDSLDRPLRGGEVKKNKSRRGTKAIN